MRYHAPTGNVDIDELHDVIARRRIVFDEETGQRDCLEAMIAAPKPVTECSRWCCGYQVTGRWNQAAPKAALGRDAAEAMEIALDRIRVEAAVTAWTAKSRLYWVSDDGALIPVERLPDLEAFLEAFERQEYERALELGTPLAERGVVTSQAWLGTLYLGLGAVKPDDEAHLHWLRLAADACDPGAADSLSFMYRNGWHGLPVDGSLADYYRDRALRFGLAPYTLPPGSAPR